jgi:hypothetical protein
MLRKAWWFKWNLMGWLGGAMLFQVGCLSGEQTTEAFVTSSLTSAIQVIVNSVFFAFDSFFVAVS